MGIFDKFITKKAYAVLLILSLVLLAISFVFNLYVFFISSSRIPQAMSLINCFVIAVFSLVGYSKKYGNLLRDVFIVFVLTLIANSIYFFNTIRLVTYFYGVAAILLVFMLIKFSNIKRNKYVLVATLTMIVLGVIFNIINGLLSVYHLIAKLGCLFEFLAMSSAYFVKYFITGEDGLKTITKSKLKKR